MATPKGASTPRPVGKPVEPDPSDLLDQLSLASDPAKAKDIPPATAPDLPAINSQSSEVMRAHLEAVQKERVHKLELSEQGDWVPIAFPLPGAMGREVDPSILVGKVLDLAGDRGPIRRRSRREIEFEDGARWEVVLEGFHHLTDEEDALDPLTNGSGTILRSSSRWDSLFDPESPYTPESPVIIEDCSYGVRASLLPADVLAELQKAATASLTAPSTDDDTNTKPAAAKTTKPKRSEVTEKALEEIAAKGAVGFGVRWSHPGKVGEGESLWGWIWGEDQDSSAADDYDEDDDEDDGGDGAVAFKGVHLIKAEDDDGSRFDRNGGESDENLAADGSDLGDL